MCYLGPDWVEVPRGGAGKRGPGADAPDAAPPVSSQERADDQAAWKLLRSANGSASGGQPA
eukprot:5391031-Alexandrium_andersonii.AAC.1